MGKGEREVACAGGGSGRLCRGEGKDEVWLVGRGGLGTDRKGRTRGFKGSQGGLLRHSISLPSTT